MPAKAKPTKPEKEEKKAKNDRSKPLTRIATVNLHKRLIGKQFKKRAPRAVKVLRSFVQKAMGTKDVRMDVSVNKFLWQQGIRNPPHRLRVKMDRKKGGEGS